MQHKNAMKIAVITPFWKPPLFYGGVSRVVYELKKIWQTDGHLVHIYSPDTIKKSTNGIFKLPCPRLPLRSVWNNLFLKFTKILDCYDVIFPQSAIGCIALSNWNTIPFVHTLSSVEHKPLWKFWKYFHMPLEIYSLRRINRIILLDDLTGEIIFRKYHLKNLQILKIKNGVDSEKFKPSATHKNQFILLTAGRFIKRKRFDILLRIFARFLAFKPDSLLRIAGDGELKHELVTLTKNLRIDQNVQFLGQLSENQLLTHMQSASIFLFTSEKEGMPMVLLEAQSCGVPVITSNFSTAYNIIDHNKTGYVMETMNIGHWAHTINELAENSNLCSYLSLNARQRIITNFTWHDSASAILDFFRDAQHL